MFDVNIFIDDNPVRAGSVSAHSHVDVPFEVGFFCNNFCFENEIERIDVHCQVFNSAGEMVEDFRFHHFVGNPA